MNLSDPLALAQVAYWTAWLLGLVIACLVFYLLVRTAVVHGMRRHYYWVEEQERGRAQAH